MDKLIVHKNFIIYDNILETNDLEDFYIWGQNLRYKQINQNEEQIKIWRISDGCPLGSIEEYCYEKFPYKEKIDLLIPKIHEISKIHPEIFGDYKEIYFRSYVYGKGTKIDWHTDHGYKSAAIFYYHPFWGSNWGGDLKIAELPDIEYSRDNVGGPMDSRWINKIISLTNFGYYIDPKPNRIVATKGGIWHSINRVDENAGDSLRFSIVCFFR